jgi:3-oxoadipate enol-lactonase
VTAPLVVLVHAGVADAGMWEGFDLPGATRHELRGAGDTPMPAEGTYSDAGDLEAALGGRPAALVGASFGGKVCLEVAARRPELVTRLVLLDCPLPDHDWSEEVVAFHEEEDRLLEEGDLDAATELQLPSRAEEEPSGPIDLAAVQAPTLVAVGEHDKRDFHEIADRLVQEIPDAERVTIAGAGHLPSLENPDETARLVREFLER